MPKAPRLTAKEAETLLLKSGFILIRIKGSHHIYIKENNRIILPFHAKKVLHPKIVRQILSVIEK